MHLKTLTLKTDNLDAQQQFYEGTLGFPVTRTRQRLTLHAGSSQLVFEQRDRWQGAYHFALNIPENQAEAALGWLRERTPPIALNGAELFPFPNWNAHAMYFRDPAGNIVEFIARHDLHNASERPFDARAIANVSEIGLAAESVPEAVRQLKALLNVPVFRGTEMADFAALGDDHGLFILARRGRIWYPETGTAAQAGPTGIQLGDVTIGPLTLSALSEVIISGE